MSKDSDVSRRNRLDKMTCAEFAITSAMYAVEAMPADPRLTDAVNLLAQARDRVADYVDAQEPFNGTYVPACVCGRPIEGHVPDEIHDDPAVPPLEDHKESCQGNQWPVYIAVKSGRCYSCGRRVSAPRTEKRVRTTSDQ